MDTHEHPFTVLYPVALVGGPLVLGLSSVLYALGAGINQEASGGAVQVLAFPFFILAGFAITERLAVRAPRAAMTLLVVNIFGCLGGVGFGVDSMHVDAGATSLHGQNVWAWIGMSGLGILWPVSWFVLGTWSAATRVVPVWAGIVVALAAILFPIGRQLDHAWYALISDGLFLIGFAVIATSTVGTRTRVARSHIV